MKLVAEIVISVYYKDQTLSLTQLHYREALEIQNVISKPMNERTVRS